jgi:hypothetical protein
MDVNSCEARGCILAFRRSQRRISRMAKVWGRQSRDQWLRVASIMTMSCGSVVKSRGRQSN